MKEAMMHLLLLGAAEKHCTGGDATVKTIYDPFE
jgi:hypothetical protein